jgi:RNA polymerase sigma-70 factor (ECF subfamily)
MDLKQFKITVLPLRNKLSGLALKMLSNPDDAEDAAQEVMMKLWSMRDELSSYRNTEAFAMTMMQHTCIDILRLKKNNVEISDELNLQQTSSPEQLYAIKDQVELVRRIIETLPDLQRITIQMKDIEGYENNEIAEIIGTDVELVRSNLSRARKKVRDIYLHIIKTR